LPCEAGHCGLAGFDFVDAPFQPSQFGGAYDLTKTLIADNIQYAHNDLLLGRAIEVCRRESLAMKEGL
jgi:hypothetical protein